MDRKLLVRIYNVGLGDCIYIRVPDGSVDRHILIDCGNKYGTEEALKAAVDDLKKQLPKKGLDLLVVTHSHEDHVRGFNAAWFKGIGIERIWMTAGMDPDHPQAEKSRKLQAFALTTLMGLQHSSRRGMAELAASLLSLNKSDGIDTVQTTLPKALKIKPLYVHADTPAKALELFDSKEITLKVLAPMKDIDHYYVGSTDESLLQFTGSRGLSAGGKGKPAGPPGAAVATPTPGNLSRNDFDRLRARLLDNAMGFVLKAGHLVNNTSVVLLLEWHGRRLLFTGDAEASTSRGGAFKKGAANGSWNVMWDKRKSDLNKPLDFLKVGHHGSFNATPWAAEGDDAHPLNAMLDAMLPKPAPGAKPRARAVISTERTNGYKTIPAPELLKRLGARVANTRRYQEAKDKGHFVAHDIDQPQRTDLEHQHVAGGVATYIDVEFDPLE